MSRPPPAPCPRPCRRAVWHVWPRRPRPSCLMRHCPRRFRAYAGCGPRPRAGGAVTHPGGPPGARRSRVQHQPGPGGPAGSRHRGPPSWDVIAAAPSPSVRSSSTETTLPDPGGPYPSTVPSIGLSPPQLLHVQPARSADAPSARSRCRTRTACRPRPCCQCHAHHRCRRGPPSRARRTSRSCRRASANLANPAVSMPGARPLGISSRRPP